MFPNPVSWGNDLSSTPDVIGLESFNDGLTAELTQGPGCPKPASNFKPVNIVTTKGVLYATIYICHCLDGSDLQQEIAIWLASLKDTDQVNITVLSLMADIPPAAMINLMTAFTNTKAKLTIQLDNIVYDGLAYFYLIPEKIAKGSEGALFIPSYSMNRSEDMSGPQKAMHDYFKWMVQEAVGKGLLMKDEADRLDRGSHVAVPASRFNAMAG